MSLNIDSEKRFQTPKMNTSSLADISMKKSPCIFTEKHSTLEKDDFQRAHNQITKLRSKLLNWEKDFFEKHKHKASRMDLADRPTISKMYQKYNKLKLEIRKNFPERMAALDAATSKERSDHKRLVKTKDNRNKTKIQKESDKAHILSNVNKKNVKSPNNKARPGEAISDSEVSVCILQTPKKLRYLDETNNSDPSLSPNSMAVQMSKLEIALEMGTTLELSHAMFPVFEKQNTSPGSFENSDNDRGLMGAPPPPCFSEIYTKTPIFWNEIQDEYIVPKTDPAYLDPSIRRKLFLQRAFIQASVSKYFGDFINSKVKIIRLTSSPYDRKHTPFSAPKLTQRLWGYKTSQLEKVSHNLFFPIMPGYHSRSLIKSSLVSYSDLPRDVDGNIIPLKPHKDWEDIMFPPPAPKGPVLFPNQLEDQRYLDRQKLIQARKEEDERQKKERPMTHVPLPVRRQRRLQTNNLVSTNFVKADMRKGKMRTGLSTRGGKNRGKYSRNSRR